MPLTDTQCRKVKAGDRDTKLADGLGLYLFVTRSGFKSWRWKYRFAGKEKRLTFGGYPEVGLAEARERRDAARRQLRDGVDPMLEKRRQRVSSAENADLTFGRAFREWYDSQLARWSPVHRKKVLQAFERDVLPEIGGVPLRDVDGPMILAVLRKVERRGAIDTAKRVRQHISGIFVLKMSEGRIGVDPTASVGKALLPLTSKGKQPALTDLAKARQLLVDVEASTAGPYTKLASRLLALTAVRPGIVRAARWEEIEGIDWADPARAAENPVWRVSASRMKLELALKDDEAFEHVVPLPPAAVDVLRAAHRLSGRAAFLFPGLRSTRVPMSENALAYAYNRAGYTGRHVPHGWRATFSTIMNERAGRAGRDSDRTVIDAMLAHKPKGTSGSEMAYNRARHWERRVELAREWATLLTEGLAPAATLIDGR